MTVQKHVDGTIGYSAEMRYAQKPNPKLENLVSLPVTENTQALSYTIIPKGPWGDQFRARIDKAILKLRGTRVQSRHDRLVWPVCSLGAGVQSQSALRQHGCAIGCTVSTDFEGEAGLEFRKKQVAKIKATLALSTDAVVRVRNRRPAKWLRCLSTLEPPRVLRPRNPAPPYFCHHLAP